MVAFDFEKSIKEIEDKINELKSLSSSTGIDLKDQIDVLTKQAEDYKKELYENITPSQKIQIARHPQRPSFLDYVQLMTTDWLEMHGDRQGSDDRAIIGGVAQIDEQPVMIIGTQKGRTTKENLVYNFGMPHPEGYRKALRLFKHANRFNLPIVTLIDTPGAYPGIKAEESNQGGAIAVNLCEMAKLEVPVIAVITGEGCSGGALGLGVANRVYILEHSYYTVISPEGCASILWRDASMASQAADALKITGKDLIKLGLVDDIIKEPLGGAHYSHQEMADNLKVMLNKALAELSLTKDIKKDRYDKFRRMGVVSNPI